MEFRELSEREEDFWDMFTRMTPEVQKLVLMYVTGDDEQRAEAERLLEEKVREKQERERLQNETD